MLLLTGRVKCAAAASRMLLLAALFLAASEIVSGQIITFVTGSPVLTFTYDWTITKTVGAGGTAFTVPRGRPIDIPYVLTVNRQLAGPAVATLSFVVTCPGTNFATARVSETGSDKELASAVVNNGRAEFNNVAWTKVPSSPTDTSQGSIVATCFPPPQQQLVPNQPGVPTPGTQGEPEEVVFQPANTREVRGTASLTDVITWPTWNNYFQGTWLNTPPSIAVTSGNYPTPGAIITDSDIFRYTYTISNTILCFTGAQVTNAATLTAGTGNELRTYRADASASLSVTECDVKPVFTLDQPNLQTSLTFAWTQAITPVTATAVTIPWGGGADVQARATFTRTVTSATFAASFTLQISNPATAPIAIANVQLSCPWGSNVLLPCGAAATGFNTAVGGNMAGTGTWLVIPASGTITCMVNNLPMPATWGQDFTQPCSLLTSNWLGTQATMTGLVLNFAAPQRWNLINNCAQWSVTCTTPTGSPSYAPVVGGMPTGQQICGSESNNAPLPPQQFSIGFSGGWIGDGTQPGACSSSVTTSCTSNLMLQSTAGTTQTFGGTQTNTLTLQATPIDCPKPLDPLLLNQATQVVSTPVLLPSPSPTLSLRQAVPSVTAQITRTTVRGTFSWTLSTELTPANQAISQGSLGQMGRYTVIATPVPIPGAAAAQYQIDGVITVSSTDATSSIRVDEAFVVVADAAVALACTPALPGILQPGAQVSCPFSVNYNAGGRANILVGRVRVVSDWGVPTTAESTTVPFTFDSADASQADGACARVSQTFATDHFDLVQLTGVAPSFSPSEPTTVCSPATWAFDVRFTPKEGTPCGSQQVVQTVSAASTLGGSTRTQQATSTATFFVTGTGCPPAPPEFDTSGSSLPPVDAPSSAATGSSSDSLEQQDASPEVTPAGLSVVLRDVLSQQSAAPGWDLQMEPESSNVTLKPGNEGSVNFRISWSKAKPAVDYTGSLVISNAGSGTLEVDGVYVNLIDASGDATDAATADCPVDDTGDLQTVTGSSTLSIPANGRVTCNFTLTGASRGSLVATAMTVDGGDAAVSKEWPVTRLLSDSTCSRLLSGLAVSELVPQGKLMAGNSTTEEEVCSAGNKVLSIPLPSGAPTDKGCVFPVVAMAMMKPPQGALTTGVVASAQSDVLVADCSSQLAADAPASVTGLTLTKGRVLRWAVDVQTEPPVNETFLGESLVVMTTWQQRSESGLRLNVSGQVAVKGSAAVNKAQVIAIPLCSPDSGDDCLPKTFEASCKAGADSKEGSRCVFNFTELPYQPGLLLPVVSQSPPTAAVPYNPANARFGGRPATRCAVLTQDRSLDPLDDEATEAKAVATGETILPTEPFCGMQQSLNYTLTFDNVECGSTYNFTASATASPVGSDVPPVSTNLVFDVSC